MDKIVKWTLPTELTSSDVLPAAGLLSEYFHATREDGEPRYSGAKFETFRGGGDTSSAANVITADDLVAVSLLSVHVPGDAALRILGAKAADLAGLLEMIPVDRELHEATDAQIGAKSEANDLWRAVRKAGVGPVTTSKLLARKRPKLLPVIDSVVQDTLKHPSRGDFWLTLRKSLKADEGRLYQHLLRVRDKAGVGEAVSIIRCFDVVVWRIGKRDGHGRKRGKY